MMAPLPLILLQAVPALGTIGPQALPATGCAAYLWQTGPSPQLVAMADPGRLRLTLEGRAVELAARSQSGAVVLGLSASTEFVAGEVAGTLDLTVTVGELVDGARVPAGTLTLRRGGGDAAVVPVAGLVGCAKASR